MSLELNVGANGDAVDWPLPPPLEKSSVGVTNVGLLSVRYLQRRGRIYILPAATLSLRMRGFALYLGIIRRGRLVWVVVPGAAYCLEVAGER